MPIDRDDDAEISAMLSQAEPPKSPRHLDAAILDYAAEKADTSARGSGGRGTFLSLYWLRQNWMSAGATLSVAAIAVSVSLQIFTDPEIANPPSAARAELALGDAAVRKQADSATAVAELEESISISAQSTRQEEASRSLAVTSDAIVPAPRTASQLAASGNSNARATAGAAVDSNQLPVSSDAAASDAPVDEVVVTGSTVRRAASGVSALRQGPQLADSLSVDAVLQEAVVFVLRSSLGVPEQTPSAIPQEFSIRVNPFVEAYRQLADPVALANVQSSYSLARSERQDDRLPELAEELIAALEALPQ